MTLVHHYRFTVDEFAEDLVGSADGTAVGTCQSTESGVSVFDGARRFAADVPAGNNFINLDSSAATFSAYSAGAIAMWFRATNTGNTQYLFTVNNSTTANTVDRFLFAIGSDKVSLFHRNASGIILNMETTATVLADNTWCHVVLTVGASGNKVYINGVDTAMTYSTGSASTTGWLDQLEGTQVAARIGDYATGVGSFTGRIDDVRIYDDEVDAATALAIFKDSRPRYDIYLLAGQSNMRGSYGPVDDGVGEPDEPDNRINQINQVSTFQHAEEPLRHIGAGSTTVGPGLQIGKKAAALLPTGTAADDPYYLARVCLVPAADGSSGFHSTITASKRWNQGDTLFENLEALADAAIAVNPDHNTVKALFWHQGESDTTTSEGAAAYAANFDAFVSDIRGDIDNDADGGHSDLPVIVGQLGTFYDNANSDTVKAALAGLPARVANTGFASSVGLTSGGDDVHFDAASNRTMGQRIWAAYLAIMAGSPRINYATIFNTQNKLDNISVYRPNGTTQSREIEAGNNPVTVSGIRSNLDAWTTN